MKFKSTKVIIALSALLFVGGISCKKKAKVTNTPTPITAGAVSVDESSGVIQLRQGTAIRFATGSDELLEDSKTTLDDVATVMNTQAAMKIRVEGHTDSDGDEAKNLELSTKRAAAVKTYLEGKGIAAERIESTGCGETAPVADNETDEGKTLNRRVVFVILGGPRTGKTCKVYKASN